MTDLPDTDMTPNVGSSVNLSATPGGIAIPFQEDRFGCSHIAPSTPGVGGSSYTQTRPSTGILVHGSNPRHVNIGNTSYISSHVPLSSTPIPSNAFIMTHPPPNLHGPSGRSTNISHVVPMSTHTVVSQGYVPLYVSAGYVPPYVPPYTPPYGFGTQPSYQSYNYGFIAP